MVISPDEVIRLARAGEGPHVEFKRRLPRSDKVVRTLCAFANTRGGTLLVGVTDVGRVHGVHHAPVVARDLREIARGSIDPALEVEAAVLIVEASPIVVCTVPESVQRPHAVALPGEEPDIMIRVGASNRRATPATTRALGRPRRKQSPRTSLERRVLSWVERDARRAAQPGGTAKVRAFAREHNVGETRASRAFEHLVRDGYLLAHGRGTTRIYAPVGGR